MSSAYVDSTYPVAIALGEAGSAALVEQLALFERLFSSNLLEAEFKAALAREGVLDEAQLLADINWIHPDRPLTPELTRVLAAGLLKGADLWHVACALFFTDQPKGLTFFTLDHRQAKVARKLGFSVP